MRSAHLLFFVAVVLLLETVKAQHFSTYYTRNYYRNRRPEGVFQSGSSVVRTYVPASSDKKRDAEALDTDHGGSKKVRLDVFYETDCPDSMRFITRQLYPLYQEMEDIVDIHLVPYGKASERYNSRTHRYEFICQHGSSECYGNTVQACVMSLYPKKKDYMNFINCMESYPRPSRNGNKCARRLSLDWEKIEKCATGDEGNRLLHENAEVTENLNPRLYFVPWILVNNVFDRSTHRMSLGNLEGVVCNAYKGSHPNCKR